MRTLVTIQKIDEIMNHPNADALEFARVLGWKCVVKKGQYKVGDRIVYCEVDTFLPIKPEYEFLRMNSYKNHPDLGEGFRIKAVKIRGEISMGLILSLNDVPEILNSAFEVGTDITNLIGAKKWEIPEKNVLSGNQSGNFPEFIKKTDQTRIQNMYSGLVNKETFNDSNIPDEYKETARIRFEIEMATRMSVFDQTFEVTEKNDGSSCTVAFNNGEWIVCSHNFALKWENETNAFVKVGKMIREKLEFHNFNRNLAFQMEVCGPSIQSNRDKYITLIYHVFDIWDIDNQTYLKPKERREICKHYDLNHIHVLETDFPAFKVLKTIDDFVNYANDIKTIRGNPCEGYVFKSNETDLHFKDLNLNYLIKYGV